MDYPICPACKGENTYHDSIQFVCPDCGNEWTGNEETVDEDQLIVKDSNGNLLSDGDDVILIKDLKLKGSSEVLKKVRSIKAFVWWRETIMSTVVNCCSNPNS